jgi:GT2 family glycosyltransferase
VLDAGCAKGFLVECLRDRGVEAYGIDISEYAISEVRADIQPYCRVGCAIDGISGHYNLITCIELCQHLTEFEARRAVRNMAAHADAILFSSTPAASSEPTHDNFRPIIYWLRAFREFSFTPDVDFDASFVAPHAMLLRRASARPSDETLRAFASSLDRAVRLNRQQVTLNQLQAQLEQANLLAEGLQPQLLSSSETEGVQARQLANLQTQVGKLGADLKASRDQLAEAEATLEAVLNSRSWRLLNRFRELRIRALQVPLVRSVASRINKRLDGVRDSGASYQRWIRTVEMPSRDPARIQTAIADFSYQPKISVLMPVYNTPLRVLEVAINSVRAQFYPNWELCICDDASSSADIKALIERSCAQDLRIRAVFSDKNAGISAASNRALELSTGEFVGLLDHDDELSPDALFETVGLLQQHPEADMIYSDEDKLTSRGKRIDPFFKPDWSPEYLLSCMYTCHFGVYRRDLLNQIGGFRQGFEGSQDYDLVLRLTEKTDRIFHIPKILYHWRMAKGSSAATHGSKPYACTAAKKALSQHLARRGTPGRVRHGKWPEHYRVDFEVDEAAKVSIVIPSRNQASLLRGCVESIEAKTRFRNYEIVVIDNQSDEPDAIAYLASLSHRVLSFSEPFNFSRIINFGAKCVSGNYLLFLNNDTRVISPQWLDAMLGLCQQKPIGIVGAKLLYPDNRIQHAGVVLGIGGVAGHALKRFPRDSKARFGIAGDIRNYSALTAACMMVRKDVFDQVGGFDENIPVAFNDVDFSLRVREAGYRNVYTPYAEFYHLESASRGFALDSREIAYVQRRWSRVLTSDPYYNPNLTLQHEDFRLDLLRSKRLFEDRIPREESLSANDLEGS